MDRIEEHLVAHLLPTLAPGVSFRYAEPHVRRSEALTRLEQLAGQVIREELMAALDEAAGATLGTTLHARRALFERWQNLASGREAVFYAPTTYEVDMQQLEPHRWQLDGFQQLREAHRVLGEPAIVSAYLRAHTALVRSVERHELQQVARVLAEAAGALDHQVDDVVGRGCAEDPPEVPGPAQLSGVELDEAAGMQVAQEFGGEEAVAAGLLLDDRGQRGDIRRGEPEGVGDQRGDAGEVERPELDAGDRTVRGGDRRERGGPSPCSVSRSPACALPRGCARIASYDAQSRAARPMPPYTTSDAGSSATSASRLFCSMRNGASVSQDLQLSVLPRGARMLRDGSWRLDIGCGSCG